ncbi:MAG: caspase family protein [Treponema sp.]|nr:caspase family protein [Treponema sp.]
MNRKYIPFFTLLISITMSCLSTTSVTQEANDKKGDLWIFSVGINKYSDNQKYPNLSYAASDALNLTLAFEAQKGKAFDNVNILLITDENNASTKDNILSNLSYLQKSKPEDTIIIYFAIHSIIQDDIFYLLPSDFKHETADRLVPASMINFNDITRELNMPGKKIIILDTHYSESVFTIASEKGLAIFGACTNNEHALESAVFGGGLFTMSIIHVLNENIETNGTITLSSVSILVTERVNRMSRNRQTPVSYIPSNMIDLILGTRE